jgi:DEAD/DEAH box helicase domain-containing protein
MTTVSKNSSTQKSKNEPHRLEQKINDLLNRLHCKTAESFFLDSHPAKFKKIPPYLFSSSVGDYLQQSIGNHQGLWNHQSLALDLLNKGKNVVVSTSTGSGKSLIFRSSAFHRVLKDTKTKILVFYPLKALIADQMLGWQKAANEMKMPKNVVGRIDGSIPISEREHIIENSRIVVMTPDVCHAWMMSKLSSTRIRKFIQNLSMIILDEAHTLEGVFGSNFAYLLRRLLVSRDLLLKKSQSATSLQFFASTATIANPKEHLKAITGQNFESISIDVDGAPQSKKYCVHVASLPGEEFTLAKEIQIDLLNFFKKEGGFITFLDSRKGVESLTRATKTDLGNSFSQDVIMPYRAGYDAKDRREIEKKLQSGALQGVVSTSALELGIDLPHLTIGLNLRVPATRKTYRQRLGRVGRINDGVFLIIAEEHEFTKYGTSFQQYHDMSVEPSYLYLSNRFMQFAQARCLLQELESLIGSSKLPTSVKWPKGFKDIFNSSKLGGDRPPEFDAIAQLGADQPQRYYPMRNIGSINFKIIPRGSTITELGEVSESQALRECYPGATYLHKARSYEVESWNTFTFKPYINVKPLKFDRLTQPRIKTWINSGIDLQSLLDDHLLIDGSNFLAECEMDITERVEGYTLLKSGEFVSYKDLKNNPNMLPKTRRFRTTGVILRIEASWFSKTKERKSVADLLTDIFCREYSVLRHDIGGSASNIYVRSQNIKRLRGNAIVVFDQTYGSLRLTEKLFTEFEHLLNRLSDVSAYEGENSRHYYENLVANLRETFDKFSTQENASVVMSEDTSLSNEDLDFDSIIEDGNRMGVIKAFTPGSKVYEVKKKKKKSPKTIVEIIQPTLMHGQLMYQVKYWNWRKDVAKQKRWVNSEFLEASDEDCKVEWWNTTSEEYENDLD